MFPRSIESSKIELILAGRQAKQNYSAYGLGPLNLEDALLSLCSTIHSQTKFGTDTLSRSVTD